MDTIYHLNVESKIANVIETDRNGGFQGLRSRGKWGGICNSMFQF